MKSVEKGNIIKVEYTGRLEDGTIFDSSENHEEPLEFKVGEGQLIKGFEESVIGMKIGEEKEITLSPEEAYGPHNPELIKDLPKDCFPKDQEVETGMYFMMSLQDGKQIPALITKVDDVNVTIDVNPPLAGKTLIFKIKILEIIEK